MSSAGGGAVSEGPAAVPNAWKKSLLPNGSQGSGGWPEEVAAPAKFTGMLSADPPLQHSKGRAARPAVPSGGVGQGPVKARVPAAADQVQEVDTGAERAADDNRKGQVDDAPVPAPAAPAQPAAPKGPPMSWRKVLAGASYRPPLLCVVCRVGSGMAEVCCYSHICASAVCPSVIQLGDG